LLATRASVRTRAGAKGLGIVATVLAGLVAVRPAAAGGLRGPRAVIRQTEAALRNAAARSTEGDPKFVDGWRHNLARVRHRGGRTLLHIAQLGRIDDNPRAMIEHAVHLTARHLDLPVRAVPPVALARTVHGPGAVTAWIPGLKKFADHADEGPRSVIEKTLETHPERIDWESVQAAVLLDLITGQTDREVRNASFRRRAGRYTVVALDNELAFDVGGKLTVPHDYSALAQFLIRGAAVLPRVARLSPRLQRGLDRIDVDAWKQDLLTDGLDPRSVADAADRLARIQRDGLTAFLPALAAAAATPRSFADPW
jgi:hypothetical protein